LTTAQTLAAAQVGGSDQQTWLMPVALFALAIASTRRAFDPVALRGRDIARREGVSLCAKAATCEP
jgi:hypothetical protein